MKDFEAYFAKHINNYEVVQISDEKFEKAKQFSLKLMPAKLKEKVHQIDGDQFEKRWMTGQSGEAALEQFLGTEFMDLSIGKSKYYAKPDLQKLGLKVGIKTVSRGLFPTPPLNPTYPEIIIVKENRKYYICGLATVDVLINNSDENLILNEKFRERKVKTGFYGFDQLIPFKNFEELRSIVDSLN